MYQKLDNCKWTKFWYSLPVNKYITESRNIIKISIKFLILSCSIDQSFWKVSTIRQKKLDNFFLATHGTCVKKKKQKNVRDVRFIEEEHLIVCL